MITSELSSHVVKPNNQVSEIIASNLEIIKKIQALSDTLNINLFRTLRSIYPGQDLNTFSRNVVNGSVNLKADIAQLCDSAISENPNKIAGPANLDDEISHIKTATAGVIISKDR